MPWSTGETEAILEPLWRYPEVPAIAEVAQWLFNDENSPCNPLIHPPADATAVLDEINAEDSSRGRVVHRGSREVVGWGLLHGPLLVSPAFRRQVLRLLADKSPAGVYEVAREEPPGATTKESGKVKLPPDPLRPPPGTRVPCRMCDLCARHLALAAPRCQLYWPEKDRDRAVAACIAALRQYGHRLRLNPRVCDEQWCPVAFACAKLGWYHTTVDRPQGVEYFWGPPAYRLTFRRLDRPATMEDVRAGGAIFSLAAEGSVRVAAMPKLPCHARWTALKDDPFLRGQEIGEIREDH